MSADLCGNVALITGASRGIGAACARDLSQHGVAVVLAARTVDACEEIASQIREAGAKALAVSCDVADPSALEAAVRAAQESFGPVDILINNAGMVDPIGRFEDLTPAQFDETIRVNLSGAFYAARAVLAGMKTAGRGTIVNVSSGAAHRPLEGWTSYCVSKAGVFMMTKMLAHEEGEHIRVFGFQPGTVDTEMQSVIRNSGLNPLSQMSRDQHRRPHIPAAVIRYLCTHAANDLVGRELAIAEDDLLARAGVA